MMWNAATSMTSLLEWTSDFHELLIYFIALYRPECTITQQHIKSDKFYLIIIAISEQNSVLHYHEHNVNALLHIYLYRFVSRSKLYILFLALLLLSSVSEQKYWILQFKKTVPDLGNLNLKMWEIHRKKKLFFLFISVDDVLKI